MQGVVPSPLCLGSNPIESIPGMNEDIAGAVERLVAALLVCLQHRDAARPLACVAEVAREDECSAESPFGWRGELRWQNGRGWPAAAGHIHPPANCLKGVVPVYKSEPAVLLPTRYLPTYS